MTFKLVNEYRPTAVSAFNLQQVDESGVATNHCNLNTAPMFVEEVLNNDVSLLLLEIRFQPQV